jgi:hypothetical protein
MKRHVYMLQPPDEYELIATFELNDDNTIDAIYHIPSWEWDFTETGLYTLRDGVVRPKDGEKFIHALDVCYSGSSFMRAADKLPTDLKQI